MRSKQWIFLAVASFFLVSWLGLKEPSTTDVKKGMIKIAVLYPNETGKTFNHEYYATKHMPMVASLYGEALKHYTIEKGLMGRTPDDAAPYIGGCAFYFNSLEAYQKAFAPNAEKILGDIPNYTNIQPVIQISEVVR